MYSYDPYKNSPNPDPSFELAFQEGDIIRVVDTSRPDGFYMGQVSVDKKKPHFMKRRFQLNVHITVLF